MPWWIQRTFASDASFLEQKRSFSTDKDHDFVVVLVGLEKQMTPTGSTMEKYKKRGEEAREEETRVGAEFSGVLLEKISEDFSSGLRPGEEKM